MSLDLVQKAIASAPKTPFILVLHLRNGMTFKGPHYPPQHGVIPLQQIEAPLIFIDCFEVCAATTELIPTA